MRSHAEITTLLCNPGVIAVVRAQKREQVIPLSAALIDGGISAIEITMTTPDALAAIKEAATAFGARALIGVGTVLNREVCERAIEAGAEFVVSPITRKEIAEVAQANKRPVMLGAYTPTEAQTAHEWGSDFIKIFPADGLGPAYIKALRAPLPHLRIVPTGGVELKNIGAFFDAGCAAVGAGSSLISKKVLEEENWLELTRLSQQFVQAAQTARERKQ